MKITAIIVTWQGEAFIRQSISSLYASILPIEIMVIDNDSSDATCSIIEEEFPYVQLTRLNENIGFGAANNMGIDLALRAGADYIFLVNQDAWVEKESVYELYKVLCSSVDIGIASPLHLQPGKKMLEMGFESYLDDDIVSTIDSVLNNASLTMPAPFQSSFVNAALWLLSRKCVEKVGGFDSLFFHYGEDSDYCQRVCYHGYSIVVCPSAIGYHARNYTNKESDYRKIAHKLWVEYLIILKNVNSSFIHNIIFCYSMILYNIMKNLFFLRIELFVKYFLTMGRVTKSMGRIIRSRRVSRKTCAPFLDYKSS